MKFIVTILFSISSSLALAQQCDTFINGQFVPVEQSEEDSIFYLITLGRLFELHTTQEYRNVFDLKWYDHCAFEMLFDDGSIPNNPEFNKGESLKGTLLFLNDSIADFNRGDKIVRIKRYYGQSVWRLMSLRDNQLKKLEVEKENALKEYELLLSKGDTVRAFLQSAKGLSRLLDNGLSLSNHELKAISKLFDYLRTFDAEHFYDNSSSKFQEEISQASINQYFHYLKAVYGRWEYFSLLSQSINSGFYETPVVESGTSKFSFKVKFDKCKDDVTLLLLLSNENDQGESVEGEEKLKKIIPGPKTYARININPNEFESSDYLENITSQFFEYFSKKKYSRIYNESDSILKAHGSKDEIVNILELASSMRDGHDYKLYLHTFTIDANYGGLITIHYVAEKEESNLYLSLTYTAGLERPKLAGLHLNEKKKN